MGERLVRNEEARGSNPLSSTIPRPQPPVIVQDSPKSWNHCGSCASWRWRPRSWSDGDTRLCASLGATTPRPIRCRFLTRVAEKGARCGSFWQGLALSLLPVSWSRERQCTRWPISRAALIHWDKGPPPEPKRTAFEAQRVPEACGALVRSRPRGPPTGYEIYSGSGLPGPPGASAGLAPPKRITP